MVGSLRGGRGWAVLEPLPALPRGCRGARQRADDRRSHSGCFALVEHERRTTGVLELEVGDGVRCHAVQFTPGVL